MTDYETACQILKNDLSGIKYSYKMLQTPAQVQQSKRGDCFEQVELARYLLAEQGISCQSYFMEMNRNPNIDKNFVVHGFLVFEENGRFYWLERAYCGGKFIGVHEYNSLKELLTDFINKTIDCFQNVYKKPIQNIKIRRYDPPTYPISYTDHLYNCLNSPEVNVGEL